MGGGSVRDWEAFRALRPDLVIVSGDLTTYGCSEPAHLQLAKEYLDCLDLPTSSPPATTISGPTSGRRAGIRGWPRTRTFSTPRRGFATADLGRVRVVGALDSYLGQDARPVIAFGHYPVVDPRERIQESFGSSAFIPENAPLGTCMSARP